MKVIFAVTNKAQKPRRSLSLLYFNYSNYDKLRQETDRQIDGHWGKETLQPLLICHVTSNSLSDEEYRNYNPTYTTQ